MSLTLRILLLSTVAALVASCGKKPAEPAAPAATEAAKPALDTDEEKVLNVYNWSD